MKTLFDGLLLLAYFWLAAWFYGTLPHRKLYSYHWPWWDGPLLVTLLAGFIVLAVWCVIRHVRRQP